MAETYTFPFAECDHVDDTHFFAGAFGEAVAKEYLPTPGNKSPHHQLIILFKNFFYYRDTAHELWRCPKRRDLISIFVILQALEQLQRIRWLPLDDVGKEAEWGWLYYKSRSRLPHFLENVSVVQALLCNCNSVVMSSWRDRPCAYFVYPEYEAALVKAQRVARGPFGSELFVFLYLHRIVGNDLALRIFDFV